MSLNGSEIYIRPISYDDTDLIVKWRNQENVKKYFFYRDKFTKEIHENWMKEKVETGKVIQFIVCQKGTDKPIGSTYLKDIDYEKLTAEYGVFLGEEEIRGMGIGKAVLHITLDYAWEKVGLSKVIARAISTNKSSVYSFLNSGFEIYEELDSVPCSDGEKVGMVMMCITKDKYMERENNAE